MAHKQRFIRHLSVSPVPNLGKTMRSPQSDLTPWILMLAQTWDIQNHHIFIRSGGPADLRWCDPFTNSAAVPLEATLTISSKMPKNNWPRKVFFLLCFFKGRLKSKHFSIYQLYEWISKVTILGVVVLWGDCKDQG